MFIPTAIDTRHLPLLLVGFLGFGIAIGYALGVLSILNNPRP